MTLITLLLAGLALAQKTALPQAAPGRIETRTRLVAIFSDLNNQLYRAIQHHDAAAFNKLVGEDFELRTSHMPDEPLSREEWQQQSFSRALAGFQLSQMAVRGLRDDVAIVSFVLEEPSQSPGEARKSLIVQAWTREGDIWTCQEAYISPLLPSRRAAVRKDRKPTGKE
jgi:hypothetical protein